MLDLTQIASFYPEHLRHFKRNILREYLQYKMLGIIFSSKVAGRLVFMGGTALHIIYGSARFSEDLDFDNLGLKKDDFLFLVKYITQRLSLEGLKVQSKSSFKGALSADIQIIDLLYEAGLSKHKEEKIVIKIDTEPQGFSYEPQRKVINKFDVTQVVKVVPEEILLSQKFYAILNRKRVMGRDIYDALFLAGKVKPNFDYLQAKAGIANTEILKKKLLERCLSLDFKRLALDTAPFLIVPSDAKKIELFTDFVRQL